MFFHPLNTFSQLLNSTVIDCGCTFISQAQSYTNQVKRAVVQNMRQEHIPLAFIQPLEGIEERITFDHIP